MPEEHTPETGDKLRVNIKRNFKGELAFEYTARGDTPDELTVNLAAARTAALAEIKQVTK